MYYILNQTKQIIGADDALLEFCGLSHIDTLWADIALGKVKFELDVNEVSITTQIAKEQFFTTQTKLSTMLGEVTLVALKAKEELSEETSIIDEVISQTSVDSSEALFDLDLDSKPLEEPQKPVEPQDETELFDLLLEEDEPKVSSSDSLPTEEPAVEPEAKDETEAEIELFDLQTDEQIGSIESEISSQTLEEKESSQATEPIRIDIHSVSEQIGISTEDYESFLDEYIDTALELESKLHHSDNQIRQGAISTLDNLGEILQLPTIGALLEKIATVDNASLEKSVLAFYNALGRLTTISIEKPTSDTKTDTPPVSIPQEPVVKAPVVNEKSFGELSLEGIKPIHFDFRLEEAANDLSLPVELIEEFVNDFIEQAHIETKKMLEAYQQGDLDTIQKIGHLLKGASSNLRINPLSDTLYEIQFCEDPSLLEGFIKEYWGHFLSFEIQIHALAQ